MVDAKRIRIRWTENEFAQVIEKARALGPPEKGDSLSVWSLMQESLPSNRHRPFDPSTMAKVNAQRRKGRLKISEQKLPEPSVKEIAPPPPPAEVIRHEEPPTHDLAATVETFVVDCLLRVLYNADLREALRSLVIDTLAPDNEEQQRVALTWRRPVPGRTRSVRVVIVGGAYTSMIHEFKSIAGIELKFYEGRKGNTYQLRGMLKNCDIAVCLTSGIRHVLMQMVQDVERKGVRAVYWHRSTNELRPVLEQMRDTILNQDQPH